MRHTIQGSGSDREVLLSGRFTFQDHDSFGGILAVLKERGMAKCVLDMKGLEFIDSAALGMLVMAKDAAAANNVALSLRGARGNVEAVLKAVKFDSMIAVTT